MIMAPLAVGRAPIDPVTELEPLVLVASTPRLLVVHPTIAAKNLDELIRIARSNPESLACGTADRLSIHAARLFERLAGVRLDCVHYSGGAALRKDLLSGSRKLAFATSLLPEIQANQLRALAVAGRYRLRQLPDVPTTSEAGVSGLEVIAWVGVFAPKGTSAARAEQLTKALLSVTQKPAFITAIEARGFVARSISGPALRQFLELDVQGWRRTVARP
jgi:tripartite-type tricarboxylate transporter receptor subunit TctC